MADFWDFVPNLVGRAREEIEPTLAPHRSASGRLDPNVIKGIVPSEVSEEADLATRLGNYRLDALAAERPKELDFWGKLGGALQEISVPVAYAQGNDGYAQMAYPNTILKRHRQQMEDFDASTQKARRDIIDGAVSSVGNAGLDYLSKRRATRSEARTRAASAIASAELLARANGQDPTKARADAAKSWIEHLRLQGMNEDADALKKLIETDAPKASDALQPKIATPSVTPPSAPAPASAPTSAPAEQRDAPMDFGAGLRGNIPEPAPAAPAASPAASSTASAIPPVYTRSPAVQAQYAVAAQVSAFDPEQGKALLEQAQIADRAEAEIYKDQRRSEVDARNGKYSVQPTWLKNDQGEYVLGQAGPKGEVIASKLPPGMTVADPTTIASEKAFGMASGKAQGDAQGTAAANLPAYERGADSMQAALQDLLNAPGLKSLTGEFQSYLPNVFATTNEAQAALNQIMGKTFLQAFNDLRGGGAITDREGGKATEAYNRLASLNVSDEKYPEYIEDFVNEIESLREVARQKARAGLINPHATEVDIGRGKRLYLHKDGHWRDDPPPGKRQESSRTSAPAKTNPYSDRYGLE